MKAVKWIGIFIVLAILTLTSISPFMGKTLPLSDDGHLHIYRSIVLDDALQNDGSLYPRYASALAYGYGASLFNYFPPTSYYPTVIFHTIGLDWVNAWKASMILYVVLAGLGAYLWAKQWVDEIGAFITAAAYIYAPYTLFDTITRGSSNEFAGMALLPFALWGFTALARTGKRQHFILATMTYALFIMAHNVMTLYGTVFLIIYCLFLCITAEKTWRTMSQMASAGILAILITAFFWFPALSETDFVKINGVLENLDFVDVTNTLRTLGAVFALPQTIDPSQLQASIPVSFSWILIILAILGFFLPQPSTNERSHKPNMLGLHLVLFATFALVTFSQLHASADLWQSIRLLQYSQFAWRPMSIGSLVLALLAGIGASYLLRLSPSHTIKLSGFAILLGLIMLYSLPWLYRPQINLVADNLQDAQNYEAESQQLTLSSYSEYLPAQTDASALNPDYYLSESSRLQENPAVTTVSAEERGTQYRASLSLNQASTLVFNWLNVAGWRAQLNGDPLEIESIGSAGFVGVNVPSGTHDLHIWYAGTNTQRNATIVSILAFFSTIALAIIYPKASPRTAQHSNYPKLDTLIIVTVISLSLFGLKMLVIDQTNTLFRRANYQNGMMQNIANPLSVNFNNELRLLGTEQSISEDSIEISLFWTLFAEQIDTDYSTLVQLVDAQGIVIAENSRFYPAGLATRNWLPDYYLEDVIQLDIPAYTPPLRYQLQVAVFNSETGARSNVLNDLGNPIGVVSTVNTITISRPNDLPNDEDLPLPIITANGLDLLSIEGLPEEAQVGDEITLSWLWRANNPQSELTAELIWNSENAVSISPIVSDFPISEWRIGDIWRGYHPIYIPPTLEAGDYWLAIRIGEQERVINQSMTVTVPERDFEEPNYEFEDGTSWQNGIRLLGYDKGETGISLYWQSNALLDQNLRLFVQIFDTEGQMLAITDTIPVDFQRPTTGWITEEYITTQHEFGMLTDGNYRLLIGWYDAQTENRIMLNTLDSDVLELDYHP